MSDSRVSPSSTVPLTDREIGGLFLPLAITGTIAVVLVLLMAAGVVRGRGRS